MGGATVQAWTSGAGSNRAGGPALRLEASFFGRADFGKVLARPAETDVIGAARIVGVVELDRVILPKHTGQMS